MCQGAEAAGVRVSHTAVYFGHVPTLCSYFTRELQHAAPSAAAPVDLHTRIKENVPRALRHQNILHPSALRRPRASERAKESDIENQEPQAAASRSPPLCLPA